MWINLGARRKLVIRAGDAVHRKAGTGSDQQGRTRDGESWRRPVPLHARSSPRQGMAFVERSLCPIKVVGDQAVKAFSQPLHRFGGRQN